MRPSVSLRLFVPLVLAAISLGGQSAYAADTYELDAVHSTFAFKVKHLGVSYTSGRFNESSGAFTIDAEDASKCSAAIEVKTSSVDTGNATRDKHLRGADFFDVAKFPAMTFTSTACKKKDDTTYEVTGDLTIRGVTKSVTVEAELVGIGKGLKGEERAGFETALTIDRNDFGMTYMPYAIGAEVKLQIAVEGVKK